ncbi:MAG: hypothetical protein OXI43_22700 [Candidatus Poribacteria bacterium]|nr:hypothetical protein [Candidatus Poribacteria bacterium]
MKKALLFSIFFFLIASQFASNGLAQDNTQLHLPEGAKMRIGKGRANDITFTPDGTQFVVTTNIGIWIYDAESGIEVAFLKQPGQGFGKVAISPDGNTLACATGMSGQGKVQLWDITEGKVITTLPSPVGISSLFFSKDGTILACAGYFGRVHVWELGANNTHMLVTDTKLNERSWDTTRLVELSPDRRFLAVSSEDWQNRNFQIEIYDAANGKQLHTLTGHTRWIKSLAFTSDSKTIVSGDEYESIRMWDPETGLLKSTLKWRRGTSTYSMVFSPKGKFLASGHRDGIRLWHYTTGEGQQRNYSIGKYQNIIDLKKHKDYIYRFAFSPDETMMLSGSKDGTITAWDTATGNEVYTISGHLEGVRAIELSETGGTLTTLNQPYNPPGVFQQRQWDVNTGKLLSTVFSRGLHGGHMVISPDGKTLATHNVSGNCSLWNIETDPPQRVSSFTLEGYPRAGLNVRFAFSLDGAMLAAGGEDHAVHVWSLSDNSRSLQHQFTAKEHTENVWALAFSPDSTRLATGGRDQMFRIWNVADGKTMHTLTGHSWRVNCFAFSPNNQVLASGSYELFLWHVQSGTQLKHIKQHQNAIIQALTFTPDNNILIIAASDGLKLYDLHTDRLITINEDYTSLLKLSTENNMLISGSESGEILIWDWEKVKKRIIND